MKKFIILLLFLGIFVQCANAKVILKCSAETSSVYGGECIVEGSGRLFLDKPIQADKLIVAGTFDPATPNFELSLIGDNHINEVIIMREGGTLEISNTQLPMWLDLSSNGTNGLKSLRIDNLTKSPNVKTPYYLKFTYPNKSTITNQDGVQIGQYGSYIPTRNTGTSGGGGEATQEVNSLHLKTQHQSNYSNQ